MILIAGLCGTQCISESGLPAADDSTLDTVDVEETEGLDDSTRDTSTTEASGEESDSDDNEDTHPTTEVDVEGVAVECCPVVLLSCVGPETMMLGGRRRTPSECADPAWTPLPPFRLYNGCLRAEDVFAAGFNCTLTVDEWGCELCMPSGAPIACPNELPIDDAASDADGEMDGG